VEQQCRRGRGEGKHPSAMIVSGRKIGWRRDSLFRQRRIKEEEL
jgi:hypothetical protein